MAVAPAAVPYPVRYDVAYPESLDRVTTLLRFIWIIPIAILYALLSPSTGQAGGTVGALLVAPTALMLLFRRKYPRWWFDFNREYSRFGARVCVYGALLRDEYPSTDEAQAVLLDIDYPDAAQLNRWLPLIKWFLAIPHYVVLLFLFIGALFAIIAAWFVILFTGRYPRGLFDYVVGVLRWSYRVSGYMALLVTDRYPPFSLR